MPARSSPILILDFHTTTQTAELLLPQTVDEPTNLETLVAALSAAVALAALFTALALLLFLLINE
jgi:hypothetical protein